MRKTSLYKMFGIILVMFVFLMGSSLIAQDSSMTLNNGDKMSDVFKQNAKKWTDQLNQKLNLTQEQQTRIQGILVDYQQSKSNTGMDKSDNLQTTYNSRIESVLNDNQKTTFQGIRDDWWKGLSMSSTGTNKQY